MKTVRKLFCVFLILIFMLSGFCLPVFAEERSKSNSINGTSEESAEDILNDFASVIPPESGITIDEDSLVDSVGFEAVLHGILNAVNGEKAEMLAFFLMIMGFAVLCVVSDGASFGDGEVQKIAVVGVMVIMSVTVYPKIYSVFESVRSSIEAVSGFFGAALPAMTAISAASGAVKTAAVQAMNMNITLGIVGAIGSKILLPFSFALLSLALVSSFGDKGAGSVGKGIKSIFTFGLGIVTAVSSAAIALQTVIASASDSAALRAARYAASGLIPVVGASVSSALSTLAGGLAYAKSTVGTAAIAVIIAISITPLVSLLIYRMIFGLAVAFLEYLDNPKGVRCFSAYKTAFDAVIAVYVMSTLVCIIQIIIFMKGGVGAA